MDKDPEFLYRYRPATECAINAVLQGKTYAVSPYKLNDRLDSAIRFNSNKLCKLLLKSKKIHRLIIENVFLKFDAKCSHYPNYESYKKAEEQAWDKAEKEFNEPISSLKIREFFNSLALQAIDDFKKSFAVVSFCSIGANQIMWSHYASDSSGFVLQYLFSSLSSLSLISMKKIYTSLTPLQLSVLGLHKVNYSDSLIDGTDFVYRLIMKRGDRFTTKNRYLENIKTEEDARFILSLLTEKEKAWSYEGEYRWIFPFGIGYSDEESINSTLSAIGFESMETYYFDIGNLRPFAICLGEKMSIINRVVLASYCKTYNHVLLYEQDFSNLPGLGMANWKLTKPDEILNTENV